MNQTNATTKTVTRDEARQQFDQLINEVVSGNTRVMIEDDGKPVAVVLSFDEARRRAARSRALALLAEMQETANLPPDEADELALEAVRAVRAASRS